MISLTPRYARGTAGRRAQKAPAIMPASTMSGITCHAGASGTESATQAAANAPMWNWPSAPTFHRSILAASATPSAHSIIGMEVTRVSEMPYQSENAPHHM